jgi:hypothetical protein
VTFLSTFLDHLESTRKNTTRTRNNRLSALHAFFRYVAISEPALGLQCQRILAMPAKRYERGPVEFLTEDECVALVAAPKLSTWIGRRDRTLLLVNFPWCFDRLCMRAYERLGAKRNRGIRHRVPQEFPWNCRTLTYAGGNFHAQVAQTLENLCPNTLALLTCAKR